MHPAETTAAARSNAPRARRDNGREVLRRAMATARHVMGTPPPGTPPLGTPLLPPPTGDPPITCNAHPTGFCAAAIIAPPPLATPELPLSQLFTKIELNSEIWGEWGVTYGDNGYIFEKPG